jgi:hypothetical protein
VSQHPDPSQLVNFLILQRVESLSRRPFGHDGREGLPMRPDVKRFIEHVLLRDRQPWIKPETLPEVRLKADGTVEMEWCGGDRLLRVLVPCNGVVICEKADHEGGGNTVVRVRLNPELLEDEDEARAAFRWLEDE